MGKRDTRIAWVNPIAAARAAGPIEPTGPTLRDYLNRDRPTVDDVKSFLKEKHGSQSLAHWEEEQDRKYRDELKKHREAALAGQSESKRSSKKKSKKKEKKMKQKWRTLPSSSPTDSSTLCKEKASSLEGKRMKSKLKRKRGSVSPERNESEEGKVKRQRQQIDCLPPRHVDSKITETTP